MRKYFLFVLLGIVTGNAYSQNLSFPSDEFADAVTYKVGFTFYDNYKVKGYKNGDSQGGFHTGFYAVTEEYGINYLIILWDDKTWDKYLMICRVSESKRATDLYLYNADGEPFFFGRNNT